LPEFQESRLGGWVNAAESARATYGVCTLTRGQNVAFNEVQLQSS
jgi:hypothetical protein